MKVVSSKPRKQRIFKSIKHKHSTPKGDVVVMRPLWIEPIGKNWWFCLTKGQWEEGYNGNGGMTTSYYSMTSDGFNNVYSLKAAKRLISKWDVPKGTWFRVSLPYIGYEFKIRK